MFFDNLEILPSLAEKSGFSIFIIPSQIIDSLNTGKKLIKTAKNVAPFNFPPTTYYLEPDKNVIKVAEIRALEENLITKQTRPKFFVVKHADLMNEAAENAALKLLEEPKENCHIAFLATNLTTFLPTILSRASIYVLKTKDPLETPPDTDEKTMQEAKTLLSASKNTCLELVNRWTDKKGKKDRTEILQILGTTIEIAYKSYFKTGNPNFLKKLPSLMKTYENISGNGHIKLQLVANLC